MERLVALESIPVLAAPEKGAELVTELVVGEEVELRSTRADWHEVLVLGQETRLDAFGYPGWIGAGSPLRELNWRPNLVVAAPNSAELPLGARLEQRRSDVFLPNGDRVEIEDSALIPAGGSVKRSIIDSADLFRGLPYRWGGTDSTKGTDCSGMVFRVMQVHGIRVPRDADDQYERASVKSRDGWATASRGDLIFFGEESIAHVGFYLGDGTYISEHGIGGTVVRSFAEDPFWGFARY